MEARRRSLLSSVGCANYQEGAMQMEWFADKIVGPHLEAEQLVDLLILRGEKDHRYVGFLPQPRAAAIPTLLWRLMNYFFLEDRCP
jgi:hypothetical protein